jgi:hypothetical protein
MKADTNKQNLSNEEEAVNRDESLRLIEGGVGLQ